MRTINRTATNDTDRNDNMCYYSSRLCEMLSAEYGVCGFGATGLTGSGSGNVPPATTYWNTVQPGIARVFTPSPDLIMINHGTNDTAQSAGTVTGDLLGMLQGMLAAAPSTCKIAVLQPFGGFQAAALLAAVINNPRVVYVDTPGALDPGYGIDDLSLHPLGVNDVGRIVPFLANEIFPIMASGSTIPKFRSMASAVAALATKSAWRPARQNTWVR